MMPDQLSDALSLFHFIRPWWLAGLPFIAVLWWTVRRFGKTRETLPAGIAPHLAEALSVGAEPGVRLLPIDGVSAAIMLMLLGAAGPTWSRLPDPLVADTAPLVVALKVTGSMMQSDIPPNRLERAKQKISDLLERRSGAKTALIAYAGTTHQVVPLTEDPAVLKPFLEGLSPDVMPRDGESASPALLMANDILGKQDMPGSVLFVLDRLTDADGPLFAEQSTDGGAPVVFWQIGRDEATRSALEAVPAATLVDLTVDSSDVSQVMRRIEASYREALSRDERQNWKDQGWVFAVPAALIALLWFRRGWTMQWSAWFIAALIAFSPGIVRADGWRDWFLTPDQQGRLAFEARDFDKAASLFEDPKWKAYVLFRAGRYETSAELYAWQEGSNAAMGEGLSLIRSRKYREAITAFEKAVERDPDNAAAQNNLELAKHILDYIETTREQSDTGEESGMGADDVVFDNHAGRGAQSEAQQPTGEIVPETAEAWMRTVDTRTGDFLKSRFALEAARSTR
ncbi:VWA domain-containing protein [uncultured Roseibium sp.]|uniref:VWA domain-containing protein n=1 Tax=uncultured Roseibium sp. TaxID=1936171 RepID=UPI00263284EE|nr:VWA domain-containing protein [uncultured Roseibium sp.]